MNQKSVDHWRGRQASTVTDILRYLLFQTDTALRNITLFHYTGNDELQKTATNVSNN